MQETSKMKRKTRRLAYWTPIDENLCKPWPTGRLLRVLYFPSSVPSSFANIDLKYCNFAIPCYTVHHTWQNRSNARFSHCHTYASTRAVRGLQWLPPKPLVNPSGSGNLESQSLNKRVGSCPVGNCR